VTELNGDAAQHLEQRASGDVPWAAWNSSAPIVAPAAATGTISVDLHAARRPPVSSSGGSASQTGSPSTHSGSEVPSLSAERRRAPSALDDATRRTTALASSTLQ